MTLCLVQYDDRFPDGMDSMLKKGIRLNQKRCSEQSPICRHFFKTQTKVDLPPYWAKVRAVYEVMEEHPECERVMWLDSDAIINSVHKAASVALDNKAFLVSNDIYPWNKKENNFNAGVWMVKNDTNGKMLMERWMSSYPEYKWKKSNGAWKCDGCAWADTSYEQGSFKQNLLADDQVKRIEWQQLQSPHPLGHPESIAFHFAGHHKNDAMPQYLHTQSC